MHAGLRLGWLFIFYCSSCNCCMYCGNVCIYYVCVCMSYADQYIPTDVNCVITNPSDDKKNLSISWYLDHRVMSGVRSFDLSCDCVISNQSIFEKVCLCYDWGPACMVIVYFHDLLIFKFVATGHIHVMFSISIYIS